MTSTEKPKVCVLLTTFNGERFLKQQLQSLAEQLSVDLHVCVSDDGSSDATLDILRQYQRNAKLSITDLSPGPGKGFAENFRFLIQKAPTNAEYYCFCDQDDVWLPEKTEKSVATLTHYGPNVPALYCGRTALIDENGRKLGYSPLFGKPASFRNAVVQSLAGGNTMVLNKKAFTLVRDATKAHSFVSHDWTAYQMVTGAGGVVIYDPKPMILYRAHAQNLVGPNTGLLASLSRIFAAFGGRFAAWNTKNIEFLDASCDLLTASNRDTFALFKQARTGGLLHRLSYLWKAGLYRQTLRGQLSLWIACFLKRL